MNNEALTRRREGSAQPKRGRRFEVRLADFAAWAGANRWLALVAMSSRASRAEKAKEAKDDNAARAEAESANQQAAHWAPMPTTSPLTCWCVPSPIRVASGTCLNQS